MCKPQCYGSHQIREPPGNREPVSGIETTGSGSHQIREPDPPMGATETGARGNQTRSKSKRKEPGAAAFAHCERIFSVHFEQGAKHDNYINLT